MMDSQDVQTKEAPKDLFAPSAVQRSEGAPEEAGKGGAAEEAPVQEKASAAEAAPLFAHFAEGSSVQRKGPGGTDAVHKAAALGTSGSGGEMPFKDQIQRSFGGYDVSGIKAHTGGAAETATKQMGASAYAQGNNVAFGKAPDLHTAAHEAAHVVQQRGGVQLAGGVGQSGDKYEQNADAVADRVVQGKSAEDLLGPGKGPAAGDAVQKDSLPKKAVSGKAMKRLGVAREAIAHTKSVFEFGAGNQMEALKDTNFNSYFRLKAMRDPGCWEMAPSVRAIAAKDPAALTAAKADLAQGGNCGEHAIVAFDFLRAKGTGDPIAVSAKKGLDHAFVLIGDLSEGDEDIVVSDPWPTMATATTWGDHFAFTGDRKEIERNYTGVSDGSGAKEAIKAGLRLSAKGQQMIKQKMSDEDTDKQIEEGKGGWIWGHDDAAGRGKKHDYVEKPAAGGGSP